MRPFAACMVVLAAVVVYAAGPLAAGDWPMWGGTLARNMISDETGLPTEWDAAGGVNVKWVASWAR